MGVSALCIPGLVMIAFGWMCMREGAIRSAIDDAPPGEIAAKAGCRVTVIGTVRAGVDASLRDPVLEQPCLWYSIRLHKYGVLRALDNRPFRFIAGKSTFAPFIVADVSGACLIRPEFARISVRREYEHWQGKHRFLMACLRDGDRVLAIGEVRKLEQPVGDASYELVGTTRDRVLLTTSTAQEVVSDEARRRDSGLGILVLGVVVVAISFFL